MITKVCGLWLLPDQVSSANNLPDLEIEMLLESFSKQVEAIVSQADSIVVSLALLNQNHFS